MPTLLADVAANLDALTVTAASQLPTMQIANIRYSGSTLVIQPQPQESLGSITTPWMPNIFRGTGTEARVNMTMNVPDEVRESFELIEERVRDLMRSAFPKIDAIWHSATKPGGKYRSTLKAKINIAGDKAIRYIDADGNPVDPPTQWQQLAVLPLLAVRGVYVQRATAGLMVEVVACMVGAVQERKGEDLKFV
jgi:hypothetical protein